MTSDALDLLNNLRRCRLNPKAYVEETTCGLSECTGFVEIYLGRTTSGTLFRGGHALLGFAETGNAGVET